MDGDSCKMDTDGDGVTDCNDACSIIPGPEINNGCPIVEIGCGQNCSCPAGYTCNTQDQNLCPIRGICLPIVPKKTTCLYSPNGSAIF